jgi:hypothetical protein
MSVSLLVGAFSTRSGPGIKTRFRIVKLADRHFGEIIWGESRKGLESLERHGLQRYGP